MADCNHRSAAAILLLVLTAIPGCARDAAPAEPADSVDGAANTATTKPGPDEVVAIRPEDVLRKFFVAMLRGDRETLARYAAQEDGLDVIVRTNVDAPGVDAFIEQVQRTVITRLSEGDTVTLPNGTSFEIDSAMVNSNRQQLTFPGNPLPFDLVRIDGVWKVNAEPIIAARRAAEAARKASGSDREETRTSDD